MIIRYLPDQQIVLRVGNIFRFGRICFRVVQLRTEQSGKLHKHEGSDDMKSKEQVEGQFLDKLTEGVNEKQNVVNNSK